MKIEPIVEPQEPRRRELEQILKDAGAWLSLTEMDDALYGLRSRKDHELACCMWEAFLMSLYDAVADLTHQREEAIQARDDARAQLQAIGRKAFWASSK